MGQVNTTHYSIFEYWHDKRLSDYTGNEQDKEMVVEDWGEPCCWACGKPIILETITLPSEDTEGIIYFKTIWNSSQVKRKLQRCHIVPAAFGGEDNPSNLFLLCPNCHLASPDTVNPASFFRWVVRRRKEGEFPRLRQEWLMPRVNLELAERGLPPMEVIAEKISCDSDKDELSEFAKNHIGLHCGVLADSSLVAGIADYLEEKWCEKTGESV